MKKRDEEKESSAIPSRRSFLNILWLSLGLVALVEFITVAFAFLRPDKSKARREKSDAIVSAGALDQFMPDSVTAFVRGRFYLARLADGGFLALSRKCTHLGCTVPWVAKEQKFICPCHGSAFDITGNVISPPAPRALDMYPVLIENDIVKVDTGNPLKRSEFRADQVAYPRKLSDRITG
jgi:cytochrome b6-f complex iron-sulfur subunit